MQQRLSQTHSPIVRCLRYALRNAGKHSLPLLPQLLDTLPRRFATQPHSSYLYVASEVIKIYGDEPARAGDLGKVFVGECHDDSMMVCRMRTVQMVLQMV